MAKTHKNLNTLAELILTVLEEKFGSGNYVNEKREELSAPHLKDLGATLFWASRNLDSTNRATLASKIRVSASDISAAGRVLMAVHNRF